MDGVVPRFTKGIENIVNLARKKALSLKNPNARGMGVVRCWLRDMLESKDFQHQSLPKHTELI